jgi:tetratricopeptide (TPR) repeat protein
VASSLDRHRERFDADPGDGVAFAALEEHHFLRGEWHELVALYWKRLSAPALAEHARERGRLLFRLGQVLEERCLEPDHALACYRQVVQLEPSFRPAVRQLRRLHEGRSEWLLSLQLAEIEAATPMRPYEAAAFHAEVGSVWLHRIHDAPQALSQYDKALEFDPHSREAIEGRARALELQAQHAEAAGAWGALAAELRGSERAPALVAQARAYDRVGQGDRAEECYRRAIADDPRNEESVEALHGRAQGRGQWTLVMDLEERRFDLASGAARRVAVALDAGRVALDHLADLPKARLWLGRACELSPEDVEVHAALAAVERQAGDRRALLARLERLAELAGDATPTSVWLEVATLAAELGDPQAALVRLRRALDRGARSPQILDKLTELLLAAERHEELVDVLEQRAALATDPSAQAALWLRLGALHQDRLGDFEAAREAFERAFGASPGTPGVMEALEQVYRKAEAFGELRALLESSAASAQGPDQVRTLCALGDLLVDHFGEAGAAGPVFEQALALDARSERALQGLERVALLGQDPSVVIHAYEREAAVTSDRERLSYLVGELVRRHEATGAIDFALAWATKLADLAPSADALETCARLHEASGNDTELCRVLERLDPLVGGARQAELRRRLATLHGACGRPDDAAAAWARALELDPEHAPTVVALAVVHESAGRLREAAVLRRRLVDLVPHARQTSLRTLAALLDERLGDVDGAIDAYTLLAREGHGNADTDARLEALLEGAGRFEALALHLAERRERATRAKDGDAPEGAALDLRRAILLEERLGRPEEAAGLLRSVLAADPASEAALSRLDRVLRELDDADGLAALLGERAARARSATERATLWLEQAFLLAERLDRSGEAKLLLRNVAESEAAPELAAEAATRLERLLERRAEWDELRAALERRLSGLGEASDSSARFALHPRLARLCRDRLMDRDGAIRHFEAAAALDPARAELWQSLALLYTEQDHPHELVAALEGELRAEPEPARELALRVRAAELCTGALADEGAAEAHWTRVLALSPGHAAAAEFLIARLAHEGRNAELVGVLERRLAALEAAPPAERAADALRRFSLRQRIAELRGGVLEDLAGAIEALEPALDELGPVAAVAEPLAALYARGGHGPALVDLCRTAADAASDPAERAGWNLRLADALHGLGRDDAAAVAYQRVLADRPDHAGAQLALRDLYRRSGEAASLAELLELEIARLAGPGEVPLRLELAALCADRLARPADALVQLRRVLEIEPGHGPALATALELARTLDKPGELVAPLDRAIRVARESTRRAELLLRKADLLAGPLARPAEAAIAYREALTLDATLAAARSALVRVLAVLEDWPAHLDALLADAQGGAPDHRAELMAEAARVAEAKLPPGAALPWLERLRALRPGDPEVLARVSALLRRTGPPAALLRSLEAEVAVTCDPSVLRTLHAERARVLEGDLAAPARAAAALEDAVSTAPQDRDALAELDRLYTTLRRPGDQARAIERAIVLTSGAERLALRKRLAALCAGPLRQLDRAADQLRTALAEGEAAGTPRLEGVQALGDALLATGRRDEWAATAEEELLLLDPDAPVFAERRRMLHADLARAYGDELGNPDAALRHLRVLVDGAPSSPSGAASPPASASSHGTTGDAPDPERESAEDRLLALLRAERADAELADRLARRLSRRDNDVAGWLELGRLRHRRLYAFAAAAAAWREALARSPGELEALRGLRAVSEQLGDYETVATTLEQELALSKAAPAAERAALHRRLGEVTWRKLGSTTRASRAFAAALEVDPHDRVSLHTLEALLEAMEDWRGALDLYESEVELIDAGDVARRSAIWLRIAEIARDRTQDPQRAMTALERAADLAPLALDRRAALAELYREQGDLPRFVEVFTTVCDDPQRPADSRGQLALALALETLDRTPEACARAERAFALDVRALAVCDAVARLRERAGDAAGAAEALARGAEQAPDDGAAERLVRAAGLVESAHADRAETLARRAAERDPASPSAQAILARVGAATGRHEEAARAAARALDLSTARPELDGDARLAVALTGAASARKANRLEDAARLFAAALALQPDHATASGDQGEVLCELGDLAGGRRHLEGWLERASGDAATRARRTALLGQTLDRLGEAASAVARYEQAIALDPQRWDAREGLVSLHERAGRVTEAVSALEGWAGATDAAARATCLTRAAELELGAGGLSARAEQHLRDALSAQPGEARAWALLATQLWDAGRANEALATATDGLERAGSASGRGVLLLVRARALEARGARRDAAAAYREAAECDATSLESALAAARLLRALGEWRAAADALAAFAARYPTDDRTGLGELFLQLGRLRAGPLEDLDGAIEAYERALAVQPQQREAREALAELLTHRPLRWDEARSRHRELLDTQPTRLASIRGLLRIARGHEGRGRGAVDNGLAILRALGAASPEERAAGSQAFALPIARGGALDNVVWERTRTMVREVAQEIGQALGAPGPASEPPAGADSAMRFRHAALTAEGALGAPALVPLTAEEAGTVVRLVANLAQEREHLSGDGHLVNALSDAIGRWPRRRLRKAMGSSSPEEIAEIDFLAWRSELRSLAHAEALDAHGGDLRTALCVLLQDAGRLTGVPPDDTDLTALIEAAPEARELLRRVTVAWSDTV